MTDSGNKKIKKKSEKKICEKKAENNFTSKFIGRYG